MCARLAVRGPSFRPLNSPPLAAPVARNVPRQPMESSALLDERRHVAHLNNESGHSALAALRVHLSLTDEGRVRWASATRRPTVRECAQLQLKAPAFRRSRAAATVFCLRPASIRMTASLTWSTCPTKNLRGRKHRRFVSVDPRPASPRIPARGQIRGAARTIPALGFTPFQAPAGTAARATQRVTESAVPVLPAATSRR